MRYDGGIVFSRSLRLPFCYSSHPPDVAVVWEAFWSLDAAAGRDHVFIWFGYSLSRSHARDQLARRTCSQDQNGTALPFLARHNETQVASQRRRRTGSNLNSLTYLPARSLHGAVN